MRIRDWASGDLRERSDEEAKDLVDSGTHEAADADGERAIPKDPTAGAAEESRRGRYKRRDQRAEE